MKYNTCGEILLTPSINSKHQYILKCSECDAIYSLLDAFLSHCVGHEENPTVCESNQIDLNESQAITVPRSKRIRCDESTGDEEEGLLNVVKDEYISENEDEYISENMEESLTAEIDADKGSKSTEHIDSHDEKFIPSVNGNYTMHNAKKQKRSNPSAHDYTIDEKLLILQEEVKDIKDLIIQKQQIEEARHNMILQTLANQNVSISNILAEQNVNLKSVTSLWKTTQFVTTFPLNTDEDLNECENLINDENKQEMISTVQALLGGRGIVKGLTSLISQNLLLDYNYQGIHNKKPLKNFKKLMSVLELASLNPKEPANFQDNMRKAIKGAKNRHFKDASVKRSKSKSESILN